MNPTRRQLPFALVALLCASASAQIPPGAVADGYELIRITDDADFDDWPQINNCGQVVFSKRILPTNGSLDTEEIFLWENGVTSRITNDNVRDAHPSLNDAGIVVWSRAARPGGHFEIARRAPGGPIELITETPFTDDSPQIANDGTIVWQMWLDASARVVEIFLHEAGITRQISSNGLSNQGARLNDTGRLAWTAYNFRVNPWISHILTFDSEEITECSPCGHNPQAVDLNNMDMACWDTIEGIVLKEQGNCRVLVDGVVPRISDTGMIAFTRWHSATEAQVWIILPDMRLQRITWLPEKSTVSLRDINARGEMVALLGITDGIRIVQTDIILLRSRSSPADFDRDGDIDLYDYALLLRLTQPNFSLSTPCPIGDIDRNGRTDAADFGDFLESLTGPEQ